MSFSLSKAGQGAATGASTGAMIGGPWGAAIGGVAGIGMGFVGDTDKEKPMPKPNYKQASTSASQGMVYSNGGALPMTAPDGRVRGPSHEQGGVTLPSGAEVEGGETIDQIDMESYVFSDRLQVPGSDMTFADVHQALKEDGKESKIRDLARLQEQMNGDSSGPKKALGGPADPDPTNGMYPIPPWKQAMNNMLDNAEEMPAMTENGRPQVNLPNMPFQNEASQGTPRPSTSSGQIGMEGTGSRPAATQQMPTAPEFDPGSIGRNNPLYNVANPGGKQAYMQMTTQPSPNAGTGAVAQTSENASPSGGGSSYDTSFYEDGLQMSVQNQPFQSMGGAQSVPVASPTAPGGEVSAPSDVTSMASNGGGSGNTASGSINVPASSEGGGGEGGLLSGTSGNAISAGLQAAPALMDVVRGIQGSEEVDPVYTPVSNENVNTLRGMETDVNVQPQLDGINQSLQGFVTRPGVSDAGRAKAYSKALQQKSQVRNQARRQEQQLRNQKRQAIAQAQSKNDRRRTRMQQNARQRARKLNMRADANQQRLLSTGLKGLSRAGGSFMQQEQMDKQREDAKDMQIASLMASMGVYDDKVKEDTVRSMLPAINDPQTRERLQNYLNRIQNRE